MRANVRKTELGCAASLSLPAGLTVLVLSMFATVVRAHDHYAPTRGQAGQFDYYLLSLSWAPSYCLTHRDDGSECSGKGYGFVLHGLWPQYDAGGYPENCRTQFELSADAIAKGGTLYPSKRLMQHEWREHGSCSGLDALSYFNTGDRASAIIRVPAALEAPRSDQSLSAQQVAALFENANPRMPADALTVACSRANLSEVRVCLTRDLVPRSCGRAVRSSCPDVPLRVPASRP
jgi:ribonuclease T2